MPQTNVAVTVNRRTYGFLKQFKGAVALLVGGSGSGKSYACAQWLLLEHLIGPDPVRILIVRKTFNSLRTTVWELMLQLIDLYDLESIVKVNRSSFTITCGKNVMIFHGLDKVEKVKSIPDIGIIYVEEATDITEDDWKQLRLRLRGQGPQIMVASFNPCEYYSFLHELSTPPLDEGIEVNHSTYLDNPFLTEKYIKTITDAEGKDEHYWTVYGLGLWMILKGLIYSNWDEVDYWPEDPGEEDEFFDEVIYGLDFSGGVNEAALLEVGIKEKELYERELLYESMETTPDLIKRLEWLIPVGCRKRVIYADSASPEKIEECYRAGFNVKPAKKDISLGIEFVRRQTRHIYEGSLNHLKENKNYRHKVDKNGNSLEIPIDFFNHLVDCARYAIYTHLKDRKEPKIWSGKFAEQQARAEKEGPKGHQRWARGRKHKVA